MIARASSLKFRASEVINVRRPIRRSPPTLDIFAQRHNAPTFDIAQFREPLELLGIIADAFSKLVELLVDRAYGRIVGLEETFIIRQQKSAFAGFHVLQCRQRSQNRDRTSNVCSTRA